jgi:hypothetical protein
MNNIVQLKVKQNYGNQALYPHNEQAHLFAQIAGTKTLTLDTVRHIMALGYEVQYIHGAVCI